MADLTGQVIGGYRLVRLLGGTNFSKAYLGKHISSLNDAVIRVVRTDGSIQEYQSLYDRLLPLQRLTHSHIIKFLDVGRVGESAYVVTQYAPNGFLYQSYSRGSQLPLLTVVSYAKQIAEALQHAHDQNVAHANITLRELFLGHNQAILLDFSSWPLECFWRETIPSDDPSPPYFIAPESAMGKAIPASDQYSLAAIIYLWITGTLPFTGRSLGEVIMKHLRVPPPSLREKAPDISPVIEEVILTALSKDPKHRFASMRAFMTALEQATQPGVDAGIADLARRRYGGYQITKFLQKEDDFVSVYLCEHSSLKTPGIIKLVNYPRPQKFLASFLEGFLAEMPILANLANPHIARLLEYGAEDQQAFLVMVDAKDTLRNHLPKGKILLLDTIIAYVKQLAVALQYAHDADVVYSNFVHSLKPESILIDRSGAILLDFSSSFVEKIDRQVMEGVTLPETEYDFTYAAPELIVREPAKSSDQYSLAVIVYEWLAGAPPFSGTGWLEIALQHAKTPPPPLRAHNPDISPAIEGVVLTALEKEPQYRFPDVQAFAAAFERAARAGQTAPSPDLTGQQLGSYRLVRPLGHGGFADVYLGEHVKLKTPAAVKVLHGRPAQEELDNFLKEAQTVAKLDHPHILRMLEYSEERGHAFLVTPYAPNGTLRDRHPRGVRLAPERVVSYLKQVADALQHAHDQKLIHRDIKPENMLLGKNGEVLLSDFGIAVVAHSTKSQRVEQVVGTVYYMAPEQSQGNPRRASDQYSLGIVAYEWLTGAPPFKGTYYEILSQQMFTAPAPLRDKVPTLSVALEQVVLKALAKKPEERYESVAAFAAALEEASKKA